MLIFFSLGGCAEMDGILNELVTLGGGTGYISREICRNSVGKPMGYIAENMNTTVDKIKPRSENSREILYSIPLDRAPSTSMNGSAAEIYHARITDACLLTVNPITQRILRYQIVNSGL